jgi:hypothetical protein
MPRRYGVAQVLWMEYVIAVTLQIHVRCVSATRYLVHLLPIEILERTDRPPNDPSRSFTASPPSQPHLLLSFAKACSTANSPQLCSFVLLRALPGLSNAALKGWHGETSCMAANIILSSMKHVHELLLRTLHRTFLLQRYLGLLHMESF